MRIVTLGSNPYLLNSLGKLHSKIIKYLLKGNEVAVIAHTYDTSYFVPEEKNDKTIYCYKFTENNKEYIVPVFPYQKKQDQSESVQIYDLLEKLSPDIIVSVDDFDSMAIMQAVKMFLPDLKWLWILANSSVAINPKLLPLIDCADGIICTNEFTYNQLYDLCKHKYIDWKYVGVNLNTFFPEEIQKPDYLSIFCSSKNSFKDCPPVVINACQKARKDISLSLYLHSNISDIGFYNLYELENIFQGMSEFVVFPEKSVSLNEGYPENEVNSLLNKSHIYVSNSVNSATSMGLFEALAAGCLPLVNRQGSDEEVINSLKEFCDETEYFVYDSLPFLTMGEKYIYIPIAESLAEKIKKLNEVRKNKEKYERILKYISEYIKGCNQSDFLYRVEKMMIEIVKNENKTFSLT